MNEYIEINGKLYELFVDSTNKYKYWIYKGTKIMYEPDRDGEVKPRAIVENEYPEYLV